MNSAKSSVRRPVDEGGKLLAPADIPWARGRGRMSWRLRAARHGGRPAARRLEAGAGRRRVRGAGGGGRGA
ncbi:hypothetical protein NKH77_28960 [Streptomyces sp. M19]